MAKNEFNLKVNNFKGLVNTLVSPTRAKAFETVEATNLMQDQDGVWTTRWGTVDYGTVGAWDGHDIDGIASFKLNSTTTHLCVIADGTFYMSSDDGENWYGVGGATFTVGAKCIFQQFGAYDYTSNTIKPYLYIVNGVDALTRYDGTTLFRATAIDKPAAPTATKTGLADTDFTYYYAIEAYNSWGATGLGAEDSVTVSTTRDGWDNTTNYVTVTWSAVSDATKYGIFVGDQSGNLLNIGYTTGTTFIDYGNTYCPTDPYTIPSIGNTTGGSILKTITSSGSRLWGVDNDNQVVWSGTGGTEAGSFGLYSGGGYLPVGMGSEATAVVVKDYQNKPHIFMKYDGGKGRIVRMDETTVTLASTTVTVMIPNKILDQTGTPAPGATILVENDIFYPDVGEFRVLGNEPGVLNTLRTSNLAQRISPDVESIRESVINKSQAVYYRGKVLFSVPVDSDTPDRIMVYDRERMGWIPTWTIGVTQFLVYADTSGNSKLLGTIGDRIIEFSENVTGDSGVAFTQRYVSPQFQVGGIDFDEWVRLRYLYIQLRNSKGSISVTLAGTGKNKPFSNLATATITPEGSDTGLGWDLLGNVLLGNSSGSPTTFTSESLIRRKRLKGRVRDLQLIVQSTGLGDVWTLSSWKVTGIPVQTSDPKEWKL